MPHEPLNITINRSGEDGKMSNGHDVDEVLIDNINITKGVKAINWKTDMNGVDEVTITLSGTVTINQAPGSRSGT